MMKKSRCFNSVFYSETLQPREIFEQQKVNGRKPPQLQSFSMSTVRGRELNRQVSDPNAGNGMR